MDVGLRVLICQKLSLLAMQLNPLSDAQLHQITSSQHYQSDHAQQPIRHNVEFALLDSQIAWGSHDL